MDTAWWSPWDETEEATILHVDLAPHPDREAYAFSLLDNDEKQRWHRFLLVPAQRHFALCRAALRIILCERMGCTNRQLSFGSLEEGKPFAQVAGRRVPGSFNVSHSGQHGLVAFADQDGLGVDVEERHPRPDLDDIAKSVYGPGEQQALATTEGWPKVHLFFRLWSMKEALIKALGTGFSLHPSRFEVPEAMLHGARAGVFRFPHAPSDTWRLLDLGEARFAAALAYRLPATPVSSAGPTKSNAA